MNSSKPSVFALTESLLMTLTAIALITYTTTRAAMLGITFDEALTFRQFVPQSFWEIVTLTDVSANNHILHTLLVKFFTGIFGTGTIVLRLPNLLGHALFIYFTWKFSKRIKPALFLFVILNAHLVLLEMFSLARGYGLAIGCMSGALWFLSEFLRTREVKSLRFCLTFSILCVYSNFSFLLVYTSISAALLLFFFHSSRKSIRESFRESSSHIYTLIIYSVILILLVAHPLKQLHRWDMFYYGGTTGFWEDTVSSLINSWLYGWSASFAFAAVCVAWTGLSLFAGVVYFRKQLQDKWRINYQNVILFTCIFSAFTSIAQFYILNTRYLIDRTALFFLPFFLLGIFFLFENPPLRRTWSLIRTGLLGVISIFLLLHAITFGNLSHSTFWPGDANTPEMAEMIVSETHLKPSKVTIGIRWKHDPCLRYYLEQRNVDNVIVDSSWSATPNIGCDYYYLDEADSVFLREQGRTIIHRFEISGTVLAR